MRERRSKDVKRRVPQRVGERESESVRAHTQEIESERKRFGSSFYMCFRPPGPALCKLGLARSLFCLKSSLWSSDLPCLLATAILDSFSLFYLPIIPPSRDGRPNSLGIGASRSFWLLPAELGQRGVLGLPLLLVSILRVLIAVSKGV